MKDLRIYLEHIVECIDKVEEYVRDDPDRFRESTLVQDAVLRRLQTMAETVRRLPTEVKEQHPGIPWRAIAGFRNVVVHDYLGLDMDQIWLVISVDLPPLRRVIEAILRESE